MPVSKSFAVDPSKDIIPLAICIEFAESVAPERNAVVAIKLEEVKVFKPAIVLAVAPRLTDVEPIVTAAVSYTHLTLPTSNGV